MKVIFLDFNGVLDTYEKMDIVDSENLNILIGIIKQTDAKIVISSCIKNPYFYRGEYGVRMKYLLNILKNNNIEVYGMTPWLNEREDEIKEFLTKHPEITSYCIIDDDYDFLSMKDHMIKLRSQFDGGNGLKEYEKEEIIKVLKK